jgi:hypothetical protein
VSLPSQSDGRSVRVDRGYWGLKLLLDRQARQRRWAFEVLSKTRPQVRQSRWRVPAGHRLMK